MLLDCPACARSYHVSHDEIGAYGRSVICPRCHAQWFVDGEGHDQPGLDSVASEDLNATAVSTRVDDADEHRLPPAPSFAGGAWQFATIIAGVAALMVLIGARDRVVRLMPQMARAYALADLPVNVRGLQFANIALTRLDESEPEMTVSGQICNITGRRLHVPRVAYEIRDAAGHALVSWSETSPAQTLRPGQALAFLSHPHDVPAAGESVIVRFQTDDHPTTEAQLFSQNDL